MSFIYHSIITDLYVFIYKSEERLPSCHADMTYCHAYRVIYHITHYLIESQRVTEKFHWQTEMTSRQRAVADVLSTFIYIIYYWLTYCPTLSRRRPPIRSSYSTYIHIFPWYLLALYLYIFIVLIISLFFSSVSTLLLYICSDYDPFLLLVCPFCFSFYLDL